MTGVAAAVRRYAVLLLLCAGATGLPSLASAETCAKPVSRPFRVYDALAYSGMPDFTKYGIARINVPDHGFWDDEKSRRRGDAARIRELVKALPPGNGPIALDIEHFKMGWRDPEAPASRQALIDIADRFKAAAPSRAVGFYGILPMIDYWRAIRTWPGEYENWQRDNDFAKGIEPHVDMLFPSLYTFYKERSGWVRDAEATICAARRLSKKPVIVFLWPEYHESTPFAGQAVEPDYWALELETVHRLADGIVLWGGYDLQTDRARVWDNPPWWQVTQRAMASWRAGAKR